MMQCAVIVGRIEQLKEQHSLANKKGLVVFRKLDLSRQATPSQPIAPCLPAGFASPRRNRLAP